MIDERRLPRSASSSRLLRRVCLLLRRAERFGVEVASGEICRNTVLYLATSRTNSSASPAIWQATSLAVSAQSRSASPLGGRANGSRHGRLLCVYLPREKNAKSKSSAPREVRTPDLGITSATHYHCAMEASFPSRRHFRGVIKAKRLARPELDSTRSDRCVPLVWDESESRCHAPLDWQSPPTASDESLSSPPQREIPDSRSSRRDAQKLYGNGSLDMLCPPMRP